MTRRPILLVEDSASDEKLTVFAFKKAGLSNDIIVARDGAEALEVLFATGRHAGRDLTLPPALVLLDLKLPKVGGIEVLQAIRANARTAVTPVVVLTSSAEDRDLAECYRLGVNSYIVKPVNFEGFVAAVQQLGTYWLLLNQPPTLEE